MAVARRRRGRDGHRHVGRGLLAARGLRRRRRHRAPWTGAARATRRPPRRSGRPPRGPVESSRRAGISAEQRSGLPSRSRSQQRVWKWQPDGGLTGDGHVAPQDDPARGGARPWGPGSAPRTGAPPRTGAAAACSARRDGASSTIRPRYITAIRSLMWRTTERSWAMNRYVRPRRSWSRSSRLMTCAWIETSRAEIGSSATIEVRVQRERPGDPDPLALAAGELVRVAVAVVRVQAHGGQQVADPLPPLVLRAHVVDVQRLADRGPGRHPRVERRVRVLEDHLEPLAKLPQGLRRRPC